MNETMAATIMEAFRETRDLQRACEQVGFSFDAFLRFLEVGMIEQRYVHNGGTLRKANAPAMFTWIDFTRTRATFPAVAS